MSADYTAQEPENRCCHCQRPLFVSELGRYACGLCESRASTHLRALPDLYADLGHALHPGAGPQRQRLSGGGKTAPLPLVLQPLHLRSGGGITTALQAVEDSWRTAAGRTIATFAGNFEQTLDATVSYLRINLQWACWEYEDVADDLDTISSLYWQARNALDGIIPRKVTVFCRATTDTGECLAELRVDANRLSAKCTSCGTRWGRHKWLDLYLSEQATAA